MKMSFARHETFYIRDGWLRKGLKAIRENESGMHFLKKDEAPEVLGMGKNMVQSLRFWLLATGLVNEKPKDEYEESKWLTPFGKFVYDEDPYLEEEETLWFIHYNLVTNPKYATTWYWFFNHFDHREFDEATFLYWLNNYTMVEGFNVAHSSLKKDFQCMLNTYLFEKTFNRRLSPEDNLNCPLRELKIMKKIGPSHYRLNRVNRNSLSSQVFLYAIKKWKEENKDTQGLTITEIIEKPLNAGKVFALTYDDVMYYLDSLQKTGDITIKRTAGLDSVDFSEPTKTSSDVLESIYSTPRSEVV